MSKSLLCALLLLIAASALADSAGVAPALPAHGAAVLSANASEPMPEPMHETAPVAAPADLNQTLPDETATNQAVVGQALVDQSNTHQRMGSGAPTAVANPWSMLLGMLFLLVLVVGAWWLVRRMGGLQAGSPRGMRVLASLPVGARERVVIADIGGEQWALGVAPGRVTLLHRFETPVISSGSGQSEDFAQRMRQLLQQGFNR